MNLALLVLFGGMVVLIPMSLILLAYIREEDRLTLRIQEVQQRGENRTELTPATRAGSPGFLVPVAVVGGIIARSGLLSTRTLEELQQTLHSAGLRGQAGLSIFVGAKLLMLLMLPTGALAVMTQLNWWPSSWNLLVPGLAVVGLLAPDYIVRKKRERYLKSLDAGMPDALDMLVICTEAGLGLELSFERVSTEIEMGHPVVSREMTTTVQEMQINADRRVALIGMGERTGLLALRRLGGTLVQTLQYGTPLSDALRVLSTEMRQETLMRFEERAARLPVLLTIPMVLFILPCIFLVVGGPAIVQVLEAMKK